jgi:hypothetical protein
VRRVVGGLSVADRDVGVDVGVRRRAIERTIARIRSGASRRAHKGCCFLPPRSPPIWEVTCFEAVRGRVER